LSPDGAYLWGRKLDAGSNDWTYSSSIDDSGNVFVVGYTSQSGTGYGFSGKFNSSGDLQWNKRSYNGNIIIKDVAADNAGGSYSVSIISSSLVLTRFSSTGSTAWQRILSSAESSDSSKVATDSSGNVYVTTRSNQNSSSYDVIIAKYNSSGTIQWQRSIKQGGEVGDVVVLGSTIYISFVFNPAGAYVTLKIPTDGSKTGSFSVGGNSFIYAASSLTDSSGSFGFGNSPQSSAQLSLSEFSPSISIVNSTYTSASSFI
jgi:hypothetical protein